MKIIIEIGIMEFHIFNSRLPNSSHSIFFAFNLEIESLSVDNVHRRCVDFNSTIAQSLKHGLFIVAKSISQVENSIYFELSMLNIS